MHSAKQVVTVCALGVQKLAEIKGLSDAKVEKLLDAARKLCASYGWQTSKIMEMQVCPCSNVPSSATSLNSFLSRHRDTGAL